MLKRLSTFSGVAVLAVVALLTFGTAPMLAQDEPMTPVTKEITTLKIEKSNGDIFLRRDMPDVEERFGFAAEFPEESHDHPLWFEYLERAHPNVATMRKYFREAERRYGVPAELLMAIGRVESNWTQYGPSIDQGWGVMHLVANNYADTLGRAAELLGVTEEVLKDDARWNILGAAAVMADAASGAESFGRVEDWFEAAKVLSGLIDEPLRHEQARLYYETLRKGTRSNTLWGEKVVIAPRPEIDLDAFGPTPDEPGRLEAKSTDYGPALTNLTTCNYSWGRSGTAVDNWVNHWIASGSYAGAISWFKNCSSGVSAHFVIRASDGQITQVVRVADTAWHAGNWGYNLRSIGVEHEVVASNPDGWYNMTLVTASTDMARYFAGVYGIKRGHTNPGMMGHKEIVATACPGATMPWGVWMNKLNNGPGGCFCAGGISWWGKYIPKGDVYCGMRVCGGYGGSTPMLYQCQGSGNSGNWVYTGINNCNCKCTGGINVYGDPIDPDYTYCGLQVCGTDHQYWECLGSGGSGGWHPRGGSC